MICCAVNFSSHTLMGIDVAQPRFSWVLKSSQRGQMQSAYQILVSKSEEKLNANIGDKWNIGEIIHPLVASWE